jgi:hypothetical protein
MCDLWVRSDHQCRNIHPYIEVGASLALLPPFDIAQANAYGERLVTLCSGESIGKSEHNCGNESHIVLKLGGGLAAVAPGQVESYVPDGSHSSTVNMKTMLARAVHYLKKELMRIQTQGS